MRKDVENAYRQEAVGFRDRLPVEEEPSSPSILMIDRNTSTVLQPDNTVIFFQEGALAENVPEKTHLPGKRQPHIVIGNGQKAKDSPEAILFNQLARETGNPLDGWLASDPSFRYSIDAYEKTWQKKKEKAARAVAKILMSHILKDIQEGQPSYTHVSITPVNMILNVDEDLLETRIDPAKTRRLSKQEITQLRDSLIEQGFEILWSLTEGENLAEDHLVRACLALKKRGWDAEKAIRIAKKKIAPQTTLVEKKVI